MSVLEAVDDAVTAGFCFVSGNAEGLLGLAQGLPRVFPIGAAGDVPSLAYDNLRRIRARYCGGDGGEEIPPPFSGGQCPTTYLVNLVNTSTTSPFPATGQVFAIGPIRGVQVRPGINPGTIFIDVLANPTAGFRTGNEGEQWSISSVSRVDNQPDDCGSPPPILPPPSIPSFDIDIEVGPSLTIPATIIYAPIQIDVNGTVNIPVTVNLNGEFPFTINGTLEIAPEFNFNLDPSEFYPEEPEEPEPNPEPEGDDETTEPEEPEDEPSPDDPIIAVVVSGAIQSQARPSGIFQDEGPDIYAPRLGTVRFGSLIGRQVFWSEDIPVKGLRSVVQNPIPWGSQLVAVNAEPGVVLNYSPVRSALPEYPPYLAIGDSETSDNRQG